MKNNKKILIINTGGTFNKQYNQSNGDLIIKKDNDTLKKLFKKAKIANPKIIGLLYKDSLDITQIDRKLLVECINQTKYDKIIVVHGTDTMDQTALYLDKNIKNKQIVLVGAMVPYSINKVEAVSNLMLAYGYLLASTKKQVSISMHGLVKKYNTIKKNKELGIFECHS